MHAPWKATKELDGRLNKNSASSRDKLTQNRPWGQDNPKSTWATPISESLHDGPHNVARCPKRPATESSAPHKAGYHITPLDGYGAHSRR